MSISTTTSLPEQIEQLFEPAARAARRGDAEQIQRILNTLRSIWKKISNKPTRKKADLEMARGMTFAIEGLLGIVLASAGADARHTLLGRKHAVPLLHVLGGKARQAQLSEPGTGTDAAVSMGDLAKAVGARPQNMGELVYAMRDCGLVNVEEQGPARKVTITEIGVRMLEAHLPGWQVTGLEQEARNEELQKEVQKIEESVRQTLEQAHSGWVELDRTGSPIAPTGSEREVSPFSFGRMVSDRFQKAVAVEPRRLARKHPLYGRSIRRALKQLALHEKDTLKPEIRNRIKLVGATPLGAGGRLRVYVHKVVGETARQESADSLRDDVVAAFTPDSRR